VNIADLIKARRAELGLTQADLAAQAGVDKRQIRRYEAGEVQPTLSVAAAIARTLGLSLDELAGEPTTQRVDLAGDWWASWQTSKDGDEVITAQEVRMTQRADLIEVQTTTRGIDVEDGGYHWRGELRLWDNEILMGWYAAADGGVRSKGTMYFVLHPHGVNLKGRWVGLSYDGKIQTGWGGMGRSEEDARALIEELKQDAHSA
jgi:transcriptional regulator with XRE-family HTH domain